jgi:4-hydroxybenzoate polyprenyltransferase
MGIQQGIRFQRIRRRHKLLGLLRLLRVPNLLLLCLGQVLVAGRLLEAGWWRDDGMLNRMFFLMGATLFSAAGGYIINDYYDVKIDILNKPSRVVVGKLVSRRKAMIAHLLLFFGAVVLGFMAGKKIMWVVFFCSSWLWLYSNRLKRLPFIGNLSIALLTATALYLPGLLVEARTGYLLLFAAFAFWSTLIREIIKDMEDMRGDQRHGCRTLPIVFGIPFTRKVLYFCGVLFLANLALATLSLPPVWTYCMPLLAVPLYLIYRDLNRADTQLAFRKLSAKVKILMLAGTLSLLLI